MSGRPTIGDSESGPTKSSFRRAGAITFGATGLVLALNLITGVLVARTLGPEGRGELSAVVTPTLFIAWLGGLGCSYAIAYQQARHPDDAPRLLATWAVILAPAALVAVVIGELLVPTLLSAQTAQTVTLAHLYMLNIVLIIAAEPFYGVLMGDQDFGFANMLRVAGPLMLAAAYSVMWIADSLTVASAVLAGAVAGGVTLVLLAGRVLRRHAFGRPDLALGRRTLWYGVRAHGDTVASLTNMRLDLLIMPAFLGSASVGLYSVAANVAGMIFAVCGSLAAILMPAAVHRGPDGPPLVVASLQVTLMVGGGLAAAIALVAGPAVDLVYGTEFAGSVTPLLLLLPGVVLMAAAFVIGAGLYAVNRPFTAVVAQLAGMAVTVPGLAVFLPRGGPTAAALVSTISYSTVFALTLMAYLRVSGLRWRDLVAPAPWMRGVFSRSAWRAT